MMDNSEEAILIANNNIISYVNDTFLKMFQTSIKQLNSIDLNPNSIDSCIQYEGLTAF